LAVSFRGKLLVASPRLLDPNFYRTVVLLFEHDDDGALGVVLNRPTEETLEHHLPAWATLATDPAVVFVGGPVQNEIAVGVAEWGTGPEEWLRAFGDIGFYDLSAPPGTQDGLGRIRVFSGYAGWDAGQLEVELAVDSWFIVDPDPDDVFGVPTDLWERVLRRQPGNLSMYAQFPHDLSSN
jgi:putative transcriptional regulator